MESITLTAADYCVFVGKDFVPAVNEQVMDRIYRIGQDKPVTVIEILARNTIEERIEGLLRDKQDMYERSVGRKVTWKSMEGLF